MWQAAGIVLRTASIRIATITMFCMGFTFAATMPYQSIVAIDVLGFSQQAFGLLLGGTALAGTLGGVVIGHFSDQVHDRKRMILFCLALALVGFGSFALVPRQATFLLVLLIAVPLCQSVFGQLFAVVRAETRDIGDKAAAVNSVVRAVFALSWIVVPGLVGAIIAVRGDPAEAYLYGALALGFCLTVYFTFGISTRRGDSDGPRPGLSEALRQIAAPAIFKRLLALALIAVVHPVNSALLPLIIAGLPGGTTADIGILAGLVAALEIPFMLVGGALLNRGLPVWAVIAAGGVVHATYIVALSVTGAVSTIYGLAILNAAGAAILLSMHISYVQQLMPDRPGLGTSLIGITMLISRVLGALVVAGIGIAFGLGGALKFAGAVALLGAVLLVLLDRRSDATAAVG